MALVNWVYGANWTDKKSTELVIYNNGVYKDGYSLFVARNVSPSNTSNVISSTDYSTYIFLKANTLADAAYADYTMGTLIDFSKYSKITVTYGETKNEGLSDSVLKIGYRPTNTSLYDFTSLAIITESSNLGEVTVDISGLTSSAYLSYYIINRSVINGTANIVIKKIVLS